MSPTTFEYIYFIVGTAFIGALLIFGMAVYLCWKENKKEKHKNKKKK